MKPDSLREYTIAPKYLRCCWYGFSAAIGLSILAYILSQIFPQIPEMSDKFVRMSVVIFVGGWVLVLPFGWKLRIDQYGVSRRLFWNWDLWPWEVFESGRVEKRGSAFYDPERAWWNRKLTLEFMSTDDYFKAIATINERYELPPAPEPKDSLRIRYGNVLRKVATFNERGIETGKGVNAKLHQWKDILDIHIRRSDSKRRDFCNLVIQLPQGEIGLGEGGNPYEKGIWNGASGEEISEFILRHATPTAIHFTNGAEPLTQPQHIERRLRFAKFGQRYLMVVAIVGAMAMTGCFGLFFWQMGFWGGLWMLAVLFPMTFVFLGPIFWFVVRTANREVAKLKEQLEQSQQGGR